MASSESSPVSPPSGRGSSRFQLTGSAVTQPTPMGRTLTLALAGVEVGAVVHVETGEELLPARLLCERVAAAAWRRRWREGSGARDRDGVGGREREGESGEERREEGRHVNEQQSHDGCMWR